MADDRRKPYQSSSARGRSQRRESSDGANKRGLNTKIHLAVDAHGLPLRVLITEGTTNDCTQAGALIQGIEADGLLADRGYDADSILNQAEEQGMKPVIPPTKTRKAQRRYNKQHYKLRHWVENAFLHLKRWRGIATRYAKKASSFLAIVQIRCIVLWTSIS